MNFLRVCSAFAASICLWFVPGMVSAQETGDVFMSGQGTQNPGDTPRSQGQFIIVSITAVGPDTYDVKLKNPRTGYVHSLTLILDGNAPFKVGDRVEQLGNGNSASLRTLQPGSANASPTPPTNRGNASPGPRQGYISNDPADDEPPPPDGEQPAATNTQQADRLAGEIIQALKLLFGEAEINKLSVPRSHAQNAQSAVEKAVTDYFAGVALSQIVLRLTKGQLRNFLGAVGQRTMEGVFPGLKAGRIPEVPGRNVDLLDPVNRIAREIKIGAPNVNSSFLQEQIAKDVRLIQAGYKVEWWNLRNPLSGAQSFSPELISALQKAGIVPVSHINP